MEKTAAQKLAKVLKVLVTLTLVCNLLILPLVPGLAGLALEGGTRALADAALTASESQNVVVLFFACCWQYLLRVWRFPQAGALAAFLLFCGVNTAHILWQARRVLETVMEGRPFQRRNAQSMVGAAVSCILIALAALVRLLWGFFYYDSMAPLYSYNTLFVPLFAMGALLCMVMSALFRQAAALKEDSDLTI